tara:strand:- start:239 stop:1141 length:903 start_codon:yes stop_codon:yes gene_type:complete
MSQIKINKIAAKTTNQNLTVTPDGTGVLEVSGDNDAAIHFKDSQNLNGVKIQAPPSSAAQDYTLILPDTDLVQDEYLQVNSITGSGSAAVGQLRTATITPPDLSSLNASNLTSGTVPSARYNVTGSTGAGYKLIQKQTTTSDVTAMQFTNLDDNAQYLLLGKDVHLDNYGYLWISLLDSSGNALNQIEYERYNDDTMTAYSASNFSYIELTTTVQRNRYAFFMEFCTGDPNSTNKAAQVPWFYVRGSDRETRDVRVEIFGSFDRNYELSRQIHGIQVSSPSNSSQLRVNTEILLYKYQET